MRYYTSNRKYCTSLLYYTDLEKRFSNYAQNVYWAQVAGPSNWDMIQKSVKNTPGHDQETFHCHKTIRQGRDSKTQQDEFIHLTSQGADPTLVWGMAYSVMTTCGTISTATRNLRWFFLLLFFCFFVFSIYILSFFVKVNGTRKHLGLIPIFWSQLLWGQGGNILFESPCVHLPLEWLEPPQWQNYGIVQEWLLGTQTGSLASPYWSHFSMTPPYLLLKQALSNKQNTSKNRSYYFSSLLDKVFPRLNWGPMPQEWDSN